MNMEKLGHTIFVACGITITYWFTEIENADMFMFPLYLRYSKRAIQSKKGSRENLKMFFLFQFSLVKCVL